MATSSSRHTVVGMLECSKEIIGHPFRQQALLVSRARVTQSSRTTSCLEKERRTRTQVYLPKQKENCRTEQKLFVSAPRGASLSYYCCSRVSLSRNRGNHQRQHKRGTERSFVPTIIIESTFFFRSVGSEKRQHTGRTKKQRVSTSPFKKAYAKREEFSNSQRPSYPP